MLVEKKGATMVAKRVDGRVAKKAVSMVVVTADKKVAQRGGRKVDE